MDHGRESGGIALLLKPVSDWHKYRAQLVFRSPRVSLDLSHLTIYLIGSHWAVTPPDFPVTLLYFLDIGGPMTIDICGFEFSASAFMFGLGAVRP